jgi:hypothetical protein
LIVSPNLLTGGINLKKISKTLLYSSLAFSLTVTPTLAFAEGASETPTSEITQEANKFKDTYNFVHEGINYNVKTVESEDSLTVTYKSKKV